MYKLIKLNSQGQKEKDYPLVERKTIEECELKALLDKLSSWSVVVSKSDHPVYSSYHSKLKSEKLEKTLRFCGKEVRIGDDITFGESFSFTRGEQTVCRFVDPNKKTMKEYFKEFSPKKGNQYFLNTFKILSADEKFIRLQGYKINKISEPYYFGKYKKKEETLHQRKLEFSNTILKISKSKNKYLFM